MNAIMHKHKWSVWNRNTRYAFPKSGKNAGVCVITVRMYKNCRCGAERSRPCTEWEK